MCGTPEPVGGFLGNPTCTLLLRKGSFFRSVGTDGDGRMVVSRWRGMISIASVSIHSRLGGRGRESGSRLKTRNSQPRLRVGLARHCLSGSWCTAHSDDMMLLDSRYDLVDQVRPSIDETYIVLLLSLTFTFPEVLRRMPTIAKRR